MFARLRSSRPTNFVVEILMIVIGISIALWFEGLYEEAQEREKEQQYLSGLAEDLRTDLAQLDDVIASNEARLEQVQKVLPQIEGLADAPAEVQAQVIFTPSSYWFFEPANATYLSMRESGDFGLLSNPEIKKDLLHLMRQYRLVETLQANFIQALDDEYIPGMMRSFDLVQMKITDPGVIESQVFRNFFPYTMQDTGQRLAALKAARAEASELLAAIEAQRQP